MRSKRVTAAFAAALFCHFASPGFAQDPPTPAPAAEQLPSVDVIQKQATQAPKAAKKSAAKKAPTVSPTPQAPATVQAPDAATAGSEPFFGAPGGAAAAARAATGPSSPINPMNGILPGSIEGFPSAGTELTTEQIDEFHPRTVNEALTRVPGVNVVNDDGFARHGGIGIRGSPPRRGRKVLVMEDGVSLNMSLWLDPSVHYVPPLDRIESIEVLRGTVMAYGPNNNHGVVNFKNLSPFGADETEMSFAIGTTENDDGSFEGNSSIMGRSDVSSTWHVHTRQTSENVGAVLSYSGADVDGAWDTERLRYNDIYGALGWKGIDQDLTVSAVYFRQRDHYDEANLEGDDDPGEPSADELFYEVAHCKSCFNPGSRFNTYNADVLRLQVAHNYYVDDDTTITSRVYGQWHRRDRYQNFDEADPTEASEALSPETGIYDNGVDPPYYAAFIPEGSMLGRLRTYKNFGGEVRGEWANRNFAAGMTQDIQAGVRYERHIFTNRNFFGEQGQVLDEGDEDGLTTFNRSYSADAYSAFLQTAIHVTRNFTVTPGARLEHYRVDRKTYALSVEEGEEEGEEDCDDTPVGGSGASECAIIPLVDPSDVTASESFTKTNLLPGVALAYSGFYRSTIYGGYHRGLTMHVLREEAFPAKDEIGDNFQLGLRSTAIKGVTFDIAAFHSSIQDFQIKGSGVTDDGNNIYSTVDRVEINGFEVYSRLDGRPVIGGGNFNPFFEGVYTFSDGIIKEGESDGDSVAGNQVPEVSRHVAALTLGVEHASGWDLSATYTFRGEFFTDEENTLFDQEGEDGLVPSVWLLSARGNYRIPGTGTTLFVAGDNLTDELYISDREDGVKPGQGRTFWGGAKIKLQ
jgi:Fe(3+) dicitrate transport protein